MKETNQQILELDHSLERFAVAFLRPSDIIISADEENISKDL